MNLRSLLCAFLMCMTFAEQGFAGKFDRNFDQARAEALLEQDVPLFEKVISTVRRHAVEIVLTTAAVGATFAVGGYFGKKHWWDKRKDAGKSDSSTNKSGESRSDGSPSPSPSGPTLGGSAAAAAAAVTGGGAPSSGSAGSSVSSPSAPSGSAGSAGVSPGSSSSSSGGADAGPQGAPSGQSGGAPKSSLSSRLFRSSAASKGPEKSLKGPFKALRQWQAQKKELRRQRRDMEEEIAQSEDFRPDPSFAEARAAELESSMSYCARKALELEQDKAEREERKSHHRADSFLYGRARRLHKKFKRGDKKDRKLDKKEARLYDKKARLRDKMSSDFDYEEELGEVGNEAEAFLGGGFEEQDGPSRGYSGRRLPRGSRPPSLFQRTFQPLKQLDREVRRDADQRVAQGGRDVADMFLASRDASKAGKGERRERKARRNVTIQDDDDTESLPPAVGAQGAPAAQPRPGMGSFFGRRGGSKRFVLKADPEMTRLMGQCGPTQPPAPMPGAPMVSPAPQPQGPAPAPPMPPPAAPVGTPGASVPVMFSC